MTVLFWCLAALTVYAYAGYPFLIWTMAWLRPRARVAGSGFRPSVTILIPAHNEQSVIAGKLDNTLGLDYPESRREILVASESDDKTDGIVAQYAARFPSAVRLLRSDRRLGKSANLHRAVPEARGDVLVFTDANAMVSPGALGRLAAWYADPRVGAVSGRLDYSGERTSAAASEKAYWDYELLVKTAESRLGSLTGANGSLFSIRRELYRPISPERGDDFELPIRAILQGYDSILEPEAISCEEARGRFRQTFRDKVKVAYFYFPSALILLREAMGAGRWLLAWQLASHKFARWAVPVWLLAIAPASLALRHQGGIYAAAVGLQALIYTLAAAGWLLQRIGRRAPWPLALPWYFVLVNAAALAGIGSWLLGREVTWHKRPDRSG